MGHSLQKLGSSSVLATKENIQKAQWCVGAAMGGCLACWFLPVVSGISCSLLEAELVNRLLRTMDCHSAERANKIYWFFRQKTFFLFGTTYLPVAGVPVQLFETYGLGQFAIHCALKPELLTNDGWLEQSWQEIAPEIFSGEHAISFYEQFSGESFPANARSKFLSTVNAANRAYLFTQRVPGAVRSQEFLAKGMKAGMDAGKSVLITAGKLTKQGLQSSRDKWLPKK